MKNNIRPCNEEMKGNKELRKEREKWTEILKKEEEAEEGT
jgi:hypothetical protein